MADSTEKKEELVKVYLDRPYSTNGVVYGYEMEERDGRQVRVFTGVATVTPAVKEDLERRQAEYRAYEAGLHRDKGGEVPVFL
jgi:hypothetical protein